jgi:murein DD-endopeptidase MepM/ murein hydrolase activator NlpD
VLYAHLAPHSVRVNVGDRVERGQPIGRCGHTGHSSEPHLHFHLQDREDFFTAAGLPIRFKNLVVEGQPVVDAYIRTGQRVRSD